MTSALQAWLLLGSALLIGAALFPSTIGRSLVAPVHRQRQHVALWVGAVLVAVVGFAQVVSSLRAALGAPTLATVVSYLVTTLPGWMVLVRVVLAALLVVGGRLAQRAPGWSLAIAVPASAGLVVAIALVSHAAATGSRLLLASDAAHLATGLLWVGSVAMLAWLPSWQPEEEPALAVAARRLSRLALWCVVVVLATGILAAVAELFGIAAFVTTPYGRTLLLKHGLFLVVLVLAASHRVRGLPLFFQAGRAERFRGALRFESLVLLEVVAVTGLLTTLPPAVEASGAPPAPVASAAPNAPSPASSASSSASSSPAPSSSARSSAKPSQPGAGAGGASSSRASGASAAPSARVATAASIGARWVAQFGSDAADHATGVAVRADGSVVVAGTTSGTMPGTSSAGESDVFVAAYGADGTRLWLRQFGSKGFDRATGVAVDAEGDAYVSGYTSNRMPMGDSVGSGDAFLAKLTPDGTLAWLRQFGTTGSDFARSVAVDPTGNVFVAGDTNGILAGQRYAGGDSDAFLAKYDASGDLVWQRQFGGPGADKINGIATDVAGQVLVTGVATGALPTNRSLGAADGFVGEFDNNGQRVWLRQFGSEGADFAYAVTPGRDGGSYVTGYTYGSLPGQVNSGNIDGFLVHFDRNGNLAWLRQFGHDGAVFGYAVAVDSDGRVLVGGWSNQDLASSDATVGPWRSFVRDFGPAGNGAFVRQFGVSDGEKPVSMAFARDGDVYVATSGTMTSADSTGGSHPTASSNDGLLVRFPPMP